MEPSWTVLMENSAQTWRKGLEKQDLTNFLYRFNLDFWRFWEYFNKILNKKPTQVQIDDGTTSLNDIWDRDMSGGHIFTQTNTQLWWKQL